MSAAVQVVQRSMAAYEPPADVRVSEWATQERVVARGTSHRPGPWSSDPYQVFVMDAQHEDAEIIVVMKSARVGSTELLMNSIGHGITYAPGPAMLLEPTEALCKRISKRRLGPMIASAPSLAARIHSGRGRHSASTLLYKAFPGGALMLVGANSATPLAEAAVKYLYADEVDKYPRDLGEEGDPMALAMKRTATYEGRGRVVWITSTPTVKGASRIEDWYGLSDQRRFYVPCPRCGHEDYLTWNEQTHFWVRFTDRDPTTAHWICPSCEGRIEDYERPGMLEQVRPVATAPFTGIIGFHVWEAYASWSSLTTMVAEFLRAKHLGLEKLREWVNQTRGETWEQPGTTVKAHTLLERREPYPNAREGYVGDVPAPVCALVCGVDTQDDWLEAHVWGYAPSLEGWLIDVQIFPGDPAGPGPWQALDRLLTTAYRHALGVPIMILATCIDSAGHKTTHVYDYCARPASLARRVYCIIGRSTPNLPLVGKPAPARYGRDERQVDLYTVGTNAANQTVTSRLLLSAPGPGYVHLPLGHSRIGEEYVAQLAGMKLLPVHKQGRPTTYEWVATRPRVEARDCANYALAALMQLDPGGHQLPAMAERIRQAAQAPAPPPVAPPTAAAVAPSGARQVGRSSYLASQHRGTGW